MTRDNKPKGFFYLDHRTVDGKHNIILDTYVTAGNVHDSQPFIERLDTTLARFDLSPIAVGLDAGYFTAPVAESLARREIIGVFGYRRPVRTKNKFKKKHFKYNEETDSYLCLNNQELIYKTTTRQGYREYHSDPKICENCPFKTDCTQSKNNKKVIARHLYAKKMETANEVRLSDFGKKTYKRRSETVERSFADAKQHHNHRYARFRGLKKVQMQCFLAAIAQNMKKMALFFMFLIFIAKKAYFCSHDITKDNINDAKYKIQLLIKNKARICYGLCQWSEMELK